MYLRAAFSYNILLVALACNSTLLSELERRARNYIADGSVDPYVNDFILVDQWYGVTKYDQQYLMPDSTKMPDDFTCGGYEPIYIKGTHPDVKKLTSTPVVVKACLRSTFDNCDIEYSIKVRKCNNKVQYFLVPTKQHASYCFDPPSIQNGNAKFSDPPTGVKLGSVVVTPVLDFDKEDKQIKENGKLHDSTNFTPFVKFECTFHSQGSYFYAVHWYHNGRLYKVLGPSQNIETLVISEKKMHKKENIPLGFTLKCGVLVSQDKTGRATTMVSSPDYFAGIKVLNTRVDLPKNNMSTVNFQVTVPIGCRYNDFRKNPACEMGLSMFDPTGYTCGKANVVQLKNSRRCGLDITGIKEGDIWDFKKVYTFDVSTVDINYNDKRDFTLQLRASSDFGHKWWNDYQPDNIKVAVTDDIVYREKLCYAHVDPHMQTADGYNYECQEKGEYLMYRNTKYNIEVLMKTDSCNKGKAQCICSLIIRAGADVFAINSCRSPRFLGFLSCTDGGILKVQRKNDRTYQVHTPISTYVDIYIHGPGSYYDRFMNVDIWMAPKDTGNIEGLCGYMDGRQDNDLTTRTGRKITLDKNPNIYQRHPIDFTKSWRLKDDENLFTSLRGKLQTRWHDINSLYCVCEQAIVTNKGVTAKRVPKALCSPTQYLDCHLTIPTQTSPMCHLITRKRRSTRNIRKRAFGEDKHIRESERLLKLINTPEKETHHVERRAAVEQNISESEARGHCGNVVNSSHVVSELSDSIPGGGVDAVLEQCIFDVMVGNDLSLADVHVDAMNTVAQATLIRDPVYTANNTDKVEIFIKNSCPGNCSQNGKCSDEGQCECDDHFKGADCSVDERDPVTIDDLEGGGLCNLTDGDGCDCFIFRTSYLLSNFSCAISGVITYIDGTEENITETSNAGEYENIFTGQCCAPVERHKRSASQSIVFSTRYDIAISNDGQNFGSTEPLHVFDSECQDALPDVENGHRIVLKSGFCFIDGACVRENDARISDNCFTCETHASVFNWTRSCKPTEETDNNLGIILGATLGSVASVIAAVGIFSIWHFKLKPQHKKRKSVGDSQIFSNTAVESVERSH